MQTPLQITFRQLPHSDALESRIREKVEKLEAFHDQIVRCHVTVEQVDRHRQQGRQFCVRVELRIPGSELTVNADHDEDVYVAVRDAFTAMRRRLGKTVEERRDDFDANSPPQYGAIARIFPDEGFGFIGAADGREFYFSRENAIGFDALVAGEEVRFIVDGIDPDRQAKRVSAAPARVASK